MSEIALVLWLCGWPLACSVNDKLNRNRPRRPELSESERLFADCVLIAIWIAVAVHLW